jgi:hypothetical protein
MKHRVIDARQTGIGASILLLCLAIPHSRRCIGPVEADASQKRQALFVAT